jgi:hypothetical protein
MADDDDDKVGTRKTNFYQLWECVAENQLLSALRVLLKPRFNQLWVSLGAVLGAENHELRNI